MKSNPAKSDDNFQNRLADIGESFLNIIFVGGRGFLRTIVQGLAEIILSFLQALFLVFKKSEVHRSLSLKKCLALFLKGLLKITVQAGLNLFLVVIQNGASILQTALGFEVLSRKLVEEEIAELRKVYEDSVDYSKIRLKEGHIGLNNFLAPHTVGNTIYIPKKWLSPQHPHYKRWRNELLVHETGHVWQYQNGGTGYLSGSIFCQLKAFIFNGNRNEAYKFDKDIKKGKTWSQLNPEQQAELIEKAYQKRLFDESEKHFYLDDSTDITNYFYEALKQLRQGKGA